MRNEQLIPRRTSESRAATDRVQVVMELTSRLNVLRHSDLEARTALLSEILGRPMPETLVIYPPFYCDYGLNLEFGERIFVNQNCSFYDLGGIAIGDRTMIGPGVTLSTAGHPVEPNERFDGITTALSSSSATSGSARTPRSPPASASARDQSWPRVLSLRKTCHRTAS
jgi:acetyltransferase-like isoleucine patch superfamily enzyme